MFMSQWRKMNYLDLQSSTIDYDHYNHDGKGERAMKKSAAKKEKWKEKPKMNDLSTREKNEWLCSMRLDKWTEDQGWHKRQGKLMKISSKVNEYYKNYRHFFCFEKKFLLLGIELLNSYFHCDLFTIILLFVFNLNFPCNELINHFKLQIQISFNFLHWIFSEAKSFVCMFSADQNVAA